MKNNPAEILPDTDNAAFEQIYYQYSARILNLIYRMTGSEEVARDLTQEVFVKVYENIGKFRGESQIFTWLYRIATNHTLNYLKREKRYKWLNLLDKPISEVLQENKIDNQFWAVGSPRPDRQMEKKQREQIVWKLIQQLSPKYRVPYVLNRYENLSYQEIADTLNLSLSAVETRIHRAKKELVKKLNPIANDI
jgi:RNA polymerase sigma-70 factor (ECF subfamily)